MSRRLFRLARRRVQALTEELTLAREIIIGELDGRVSKQVQKRIDQYKALVERNDSDV